MNIISVFHSHLNAFLLQKLSTFQSLYYQYVKRDYNSKNHLDEYNNYIFSYAYHCHEGMLAFAYALNATIMGRFKTHT